MTIRLAQSISLIAAVERLGSRDHLCSIYESQQEHFAVAVSFIRIGLDRGEKYFYIVLPDLSLKHVHALGHPFVNESSELVEYIGTVMDVTDQHQGRSALEKAFDEIKTLKEQLHRENLALREEIDQISMFEEIVGSSAALQAVLSRVARVAPADSTVLITGETGTGKELVTRAIHKRSQGFGRAFVSVTGANFSGPQRNEAVASQ